MRILRLIAIASIVASPSAFAARDAGESDDPLISGFPAFAGWFRGHGGTLDDRIDIGYEPGTGTKKIRGMIATADIPKGTVLINTPGSLVVPIPGNDQCQIIQSIKSEIKVGDQSKWHPYFEYDDSSGSHHVPNQWDKTGRAIIELQELPPAGDTHRHSDWYQEACNKGKELSELDWKAFVMFLTRAADIGLVPMYDLMNHSNGKINTRLERTDDGGLRVVASVDISINTPIYNTYARGGMESTVEVFNTYGFVDDYPQIFRWTDENLVKLSQENADHANNRYGMTGSDGNTDPKHRLEFTPNTPHYEVLVVSPTLAALSPTKQLVEILGNGQRSLEEWEMLITSQHANLRASHVLELHNSASAILNELPTTIEQDEAILPNERRLLEKVRKVGRIDVNKADAIQAIEFRLAFKQALRLSVEAAEKGMFLEDREL